MPKVNVNDIEIYYEEHGEGIPLILICGLGANSTFWSPEFVNSLSESFRLVLFDNRGTGRTDKPDAPYSIKTMSEDTATLMEQIGIKNAHIFGTSMGGMIAQELTLNHPEKVLKLVLACTTCGGPNSVGIEETADTFERVFNPKPGDSPQDLLGSLIRFCYSQNYYEEHWENIVERFSTNKYPTPQFAMNRQIEACRKHDTYSKLHEITQKTLIISGDQDLVIPVENSHILAERIPNSKLITLPGAGHVFLFEREKETIENTLDFLQET